MNTNHVIPVILFAYARPGHLRQTIECLRTNAVPLIYAFSDAPRTEDKVSAVAEVRSILREIDWCKTVICEREINMGLGRSVLSGVSSVLERHDAALVFEDDLVCVPGTYNYLCAAMNHYCDHPRVMSVTGWTHPRITPDDVANLPYFDGHAECWVWGTWAKYWPGMSETALELMKRCEEKGQNIARYGSDLPKMAADELRKNLWAVRFWYLHLLHESLCLRPPYSLVEHLGFDQEATTSAGFWEWANPPLRPCPSIPAVWPDVYEHPACASLWRKTVADE